MTSNRGQSHRAADGEAALIDGLCHEESSRSAGECVDLVLHFNANTTIWISPCRWKKLADGLGGKLAFSPLRNRRSRFASERGRIKNIRGRCAVENPAPHRTTASDILYSPSFPRTEQRFTRGAPVGSRRPFSSIGLVRACACPPFFSKAFGAVLHQKPARLDVSFRSQGWTGRNSQYMSPGSVR